MSIIDEPDDEVVYRDDEYMILMLSRILRPFGYDVYKKMNFENSRWWKKDAFFTTYKDAEQFIKDNR